MQFHPKVYAQEKKACPQSLLIMFTALFVTAKMWKEPKCPSVDGWMNKQNVVIFIQQNTIWTDKILIQLLQHGRKHAN